MKHGLLISAMSFALAIGASPSFAINPGPAALGLGSGVANEMVGQRLAQMQPGQGQQGGEQGGVTPGSKPSKRGAKTQPSGQPSGKMGQQGEKMGTPGQPGSPRKAEGQPSGQPGEKMGVGAQPKGQEKASESEQPSGQRKMGTGEPSGTRMGTSGGKQPGVKGTESERSESRISAAGAAGAKGSASLTVQDRTKITTVIREAKVRPLENVTFSISVGARIPRDVHLYALPREVVEIHPVWRHYEYILVRDEIIVVNPRTFEIVAELPLT